MEWFIIQDGMHTGPFSERSLHEELGKSDAEGLTEIWKEGWPAPLSYKDVFPNGGKDLPPELPVEAKSSLDKLVKAPESVDDDEWPINETSLSTDEDTPLKKESTKWLLIITLLFCIGVSYIYVKNQFKSFSRPLKMNISEFQKLSKITKKDLSSPKFMFSISHDKKHLWAATNIQLTGGVEFHFKSSKDKVLGENVEFTATAFLENGLLELNDFRFIKSSNIIDGYYSVEIKTSKKLVKNILQQILGAKHETISLKKDFFISSINEYAFEKALRKFLEKKRRNENHFFVELKEK